MSKAGLRVPYDIIGDIAVLKIFDEPTARDLRSMARVIMSRDRHIKTVLYQASPVGGRFRTRKLVWVLGQRKTSTVHKEYGCLFSVDLSRVYFSPRLLYERMRIARLVQPGEVVVNMFAGVGCFSIIIARFSRARRIYSIDLNPVAVKFMEENVRLNGVGGRVVALEGDAKDVVEQRLRGIADRVLMPLPEKAYDYLPYALLALKDGGGWAHYYDFAHAGKGEDPVGLARAKVSDRLGSLGIEFSIPFGRIVRKVGPRYYQVALDIRARKRSPEGA